MILATFVTNKTSWSRTDVVLNKQLYEVYCYDFLSRVYLKVEEISATNPCNGLKNGLI